VLFFVVAYGLSWLWWLPLAVSGALVRPGSLPTHIPGLLGPALAALWTAWAIDGKPTFNALVSRIVRYRISFLGWAASLFPLGVLFLGAIAQVLTVGAWPDIEGLGRYSGIPEFGVLPVMLIAFLGNGLGEEIGWRGYALPRLQAHYGTRLGTLVLWPIWALWHLPNFWFLASFLQMDLLTIAAGWGLGILAGTLVLAKVTNLAGGSIIAAAIWHTSYNAAAATDLGTMIPMIATILVMIWAALLFVHEWKRPETSWLVVPALPPSQNRS
jgi:membrane protease YdiL (CAAX protease family)